MDVEETSAPLHENLSDVINEPTVGNFLELSPALTVEQIVYILIGIVGIVGNGLVIVVLCSSVTLRQKTTNMFIINQSVIDFLASVFLISHSSVSYDSSGYDGGIVSQIICRIWNSKVFMWASFNASTYNLVALTLERYVLIIHPIKHKTSFGKREALIVMIIAWLVGYGYQFCLVIPTSGVRDGICVYLKIWPNPEVGKFCGILTAFVKYFIPLVIMVYAYARMILVIMGKANTEKKENIQGSSGQGKDSSGNAKVVNASRANKMQRVGRNILKTLILVSACFVVCWTGNQALFLFRNLGYPVDFNGWFYHFTVYLVFINCCTNPFVYVLQYKHFQTQLIWLFSRKRVQPDFEGSIDQASHRQTLSTVEN